MALATIDRGQERWIATVAGDCSRR